jgi:hypothetical protein
MSEQATAAADNSRRRPNHHPLQGSERWLSTNLPILPSIATTSPGAARSRAPPPSARSRFRLVLLLWRLPTPTPAFAAIEAGYRRWQAIMAERDRLQELVEELADRAHAELEPMFPPKPERAPEIVEWITEEGAYTRGSSAVPRKLRKKVEAHWSAMIDYRHACNDVVEGHPAIEATCDADAKAEELKGEADRVRLEVLAIPTRTPQGMLIKLAIAAEARSLDDLEQAVTVDTLYQCPWIGEEFLPALLTDLRAMVAGTPLAA